MRIALLLCLGLWPLLAPATEVYRWVDKEGVAHYGDKPPTPDAKPVVLPPIQSIGPVAPLGASGSSSEPAAKGPSNLKISIDSPASDDVFRGDDRRLTVSVRLGQPLVEGQGLLFLLDGTPQNSTPTSAQAYTLENVERGSHLLSATIVDAKGREIGRAPPVIVHMKPPTADMAPKPPRAPPKGK